MQSKNIIGRIIICIATMVIASCVYIFAHQEHEYAAARDSYDELEEAVFGKGLPGDNGGVGGTDAASSGITLSAQTGDTSDADEGSAAAGDYDDLELNWAVLSKYNVVGWLKVPSNPKISYPIMRGKDNTYYLHHLYNGQYRYAGSIFMNYKNSADFTDQNTIIYGHNMKDGSMFHDLRYYVKASYCRSHPTFDIYLPDGTKHTYTIFAAAEAMDSSSAYTYKFGTLQDFFNWAKERCEASNYKPGIEIMEDDHVVSLSSCSPNGSKAGHRVMIHGVETYVVQVQ